MKARNRHANISIYAFILMALLTFFASARNDNWTDWDLYKVFFIENINANRDFEIGYAYWNYLIHHITDNYNLFLAISYGLLSYVFFLTSRFFCKSKYLYSFLVFYSLFFLSSGGFRQYHAEHFFILSLYFLFRKKYYYAAFFFVLGGLFHRTLYLCAPFVFFMAFTFDNKRFLTFLIVGFAMYYLNVFEIILSLVFPILGLGGLESFLFRVNFYVNAGVEFSLLSIGFFRKVLFAMFYLYIQKRIEYRDDIFSKLLSLYIIGIFVSMVLPGTFGRFANFFFFIECFLLPRSLLYLNNPLRIRICWIVVVVLYISFAHRLISFYPELFLPYNFVC